MNNKIQLKAEPSYVAYLPKGECAYCDIRFSEPTWVFPPHTASLNCKSGKHNHCICDTCF